MKAKYVFVWNGSTYQNDVNIASVVGEKVAETDDVWMEKVLV